VNDAPSRLGRTRLRSNLEAQPEDPVEEIKRLRRCINDLVGVLALPAIWSGSDPSQIARTLLDVLLGMLRLDLVYARLENPIGEAPIELVRVAQARKSTVQPHEIGAMLESWLEPDRQKSAPLVRNPIGEGNLSIVPLRLGLQGEIGVIVAGSARADFPRQTEKLLLSVAANQAAIGLQEARHLRERKRVANELDQQVAQRTRELAAANQGLKTEIAEHKLAEVRLRREERELKRSEARKAAILNSALDCIVTIDHESCITEFNPAAERTFGYRRDEVVGRQLAQVIIPPSLREMHQRGFARFLATGEAPAIGKRLEMTAIRADGSEFPVELAITRIPSDGPPSFTGYLRDITERKRSEEALGKARSELAHVARVSSLGALTASIAHEVNQPLSGIVTNAGTCLRMLAADPPNVDGARETARRTLRDANRASEVVTRLRALFSKKVAMTESVDLNQATQEVIALSLSELQRCRVILRTEFTDDLPPVTGDRVQLQQVILNLFLNASDAMSGVQDRPRQLVIRTERGEEDHVRVSVQDTGVGLESQSADRLFDAFYTTKSSGMGIGLSVSRSIIESHQGRLWAAPNVGPGATFSFSIPRRPEGKPDGQSLGT
jgi:PAS domain S-box-containing protein